MEGNGGSERSETSDGILDQQVVAMCNGNTTISLAAKTMRSGSGIGMWTALGATGLVAGTTAELFKSRRRDGLGKIRCCRKVEIGTGTEPPGTQQRDDHAQQPTKNREEGRPIREKKGAEVGPEVCRKGSEKETKGGRKDESE
jgi:hypothetical protein